jgi:hypothetical protein
MGVLLSSMAMASLATAGTAVQPEPPIYVSFSLADDAKSQRWYSLVPSDSPVLLPVVMQQSSNAVWIDVGRIPGVDAPLAVVGERCGDGLRTV